MGISPRRPSSSTSGAASPNIASCAMNPWAVAISVRATWSDGTSAAGMPVSRYTSTSSAQAEAGAFGLTVPAIGATVAGFAALIGPPGGGLGALVMVLLGNPFSGITSAPELLPRPVGTIGQLPPPGAGGSLLRSVAFFDGSAAGGAALTLTVWVAPGLAAVLSRGRRRAPAAFPAPGTPEPALVG